MRDDVAIVRAGAEAVEQLEPLFLALHDHHRTVTALPLVDDVTAWRARRATYLAWLAEDRALLLVARAAGAPVGYALVVRHEGADDTFPLAPGYAELYTLSVAAGARGAGVGGRLLDAVDEALADEGDPPLVIAVMAGNDDALRLYTRRGMVPGELLLYRFGGRRRSAPPG
jgi:ribosomal protein S18 acetylase RimI-like enzyme